MRRGRRWLGQRLELVAAEPKGLEGGEVADGLGQRLELVVVEPEE